MSDLIYSEGDGRGHSHSRSRSPIGNMGKDTDKSRLGARRNAVNNYPGIKTKTDLHNMTKNKRKREQEKDSTSNMADFAMNAGNDEEMTENGLVANLQHKHLRSLIL